MNSLDIEGFFWLPDNPDHRVAGRLAYNVVGGGKLSLIGGFDAAADTSRIIGQSSNNFYTLEDCFQTRVDGIINEVRQEVHRVGRVIVGVAYDKDESLCFDGFSIRLAHLVQWVEPPRFEERVERLEGERRGWGELTLISKPLEPMAVTLETGELRLEQTRGTEGDGVTSRSFTQTLYFRMRFDQVLSLVDVIDVASDLQDLVSIATCRTAAFEEIGLFHPDLSYEVPNGKRYPRPVHLIAEWIAQPDPKKRIADEIFTFREMGGIEGVGRWLEVAKKYRAPLGQAMATKYTRHMFVQNRFLNYVTALEGLHRAWSGAEDSWFRTRIVELAELAGAPFDNLVGDVGAWSATVRDHRNNIAHHLGRQLHQRSSEIYYLADSGYWLFVLCMLRLLHAPDVVFDNVAQHPEFDWLTQGLTHVQYS